MNYRIIFFIAIFILSSCKKQQTKLIHLSAKNSKTGVSYANLTYTVSEEILESGEPIKVIESGTLDSKGEADFELRVKKNHVYILILNEPPNICYRNMQDTLFITDKSLDYTFDYEFIPCAHLKNNLVNVNCQGSSDKLRLYYRNTSLQHDGCSSWFPTFFTDIPMGQIDYKWIVERAGQKDTFYDSFYLGEGEYKTYQLNY